MSDASQPDSTERAKHLRTIQSLMVLLCLVHIMIMFGNPRASQAERDLLKIQRLCSNWSSIWQVDSETYILDELDRALSFSAWNRFIVGKATFDGDYDVNLVMSPLVCMDSFGVKPTLLRSGQTLSEITAPTNLEAFAKIWNNCSDTSLAWELHPGNEGFAFVTSSAADAKPSRIDIRVQDSEPSATGTSLRISKFTIYPVMQDLVLEPIDPSEPPVYYTAEVEGDVERLGTITCEIRIAAQATRHVAIDWQAFLTELAGADWETGTSFDEAFPELDSLIGDSSWQSFETISERLGFVLDQDRTSPTIFGVSIPRNGILFWGPILLSMLQVYFFLHLRELLKTKSDDLIWQYPWLGLFRRPLGWLSILFLSGLLPLAVVLLGVKEAQTNTALFSSQPILYLIVLMTAITAVLIHLIARKIEELNPN